MLCTWSPLYFSINSLINNAKTVYKFDKFFLPETQNEELYFSNYFFKKLDLSPHVMSIIEESLKPKHLQSYAISNCKKFPNDINFIIKRNFFTLNSERKENDNIGIFTKNNDNSKNKQINEIINQFKLKPLIQLHLIEAYLIGYDRNINQLTSRNKWWMRFNIFNLCAIIIIAFFIYKIFNGTGKNATSMSNFLLKSWIDSGATMVNKVDVKFDDVQGCDEVKKELQDVVCFLKDPTIFTKIGAKLPKGVLLCGEPGLGKTLLARAVAGEADVPFLYISGSQFDEMFVGVGASRIRSLFNEAKANSPCVVFIDELDAVCSKRTTSPFQPHANQSINQLLSEMDGFVENEGIIVIGATNRENSLDKAILRPGRFDLKIKVYPPDYKGRLSLFNLYLSKVKHLGNIDVPSLARATMGSTGADIKNMVNQAAILCTLKHESSITMSHLWEAQTKILLGSARSRPSQEKDNILTAYHEAGHSIVNYFSPKSPYKIKLITIIPRGHTGGHNSFLPKVESGYQSKAEIMAVIDGLMGGRAAEELLNGIENISTGVSSDMKHATDLARRMVQTYSMSDEIGLQVFENKSCFCGSLPSSPKISELIDAEVNRILQESYTRAKEIIQEHKAEWNLLAKSLLKYETLETEDIELVINGKKPKIAVITEEMSTKHQTNPLTGGVNRFLGLFSGKDDKK